MHFVVHSAYVWFIACSGTEEGKQVTSLGFCTRCLSSSSFNFGMLVVVKLIFSCNVLQQV